VALELGRVAGRLDKIEEAVVAVTDFEIFKHSDKI
jgi:hypothetical protein